MDKWRLFYLGPSEQSLFDCNQNTHLKSNSERVQLTFLTFGPWMARESGPYVLQRLVAVVYAHTPSRLNSCWDEFIVFILHHSDPWLLRHHLDVAYPFAFRDRINDPNILSSEDSGAFDPPLMVLFLLLKGFCACTMTGLFLWSLRLSTQLSSCAL